ncbi:MAG: EAL domain-containing protein, partial [Pseudomonadota bacterium]
DYLDEIEARTGLSITVTTGYTWSELLSLIQRKEIDMLPMMYWTEQRGRDFNLTNPYITVRHYAFVSADAEALNELADLQGHTVAIPKDYASITYLTENYPGIQILEVNTTLDAIDAVVTGQADAVIEQLAGISYYMRQQNVTGLVPAFPIKFHVNNVHMAVRSDWPLLRDIVQKALDDISAETSTQIMARWTGSEATAKTFLTAQVEFSPAEKAYLAARTSLVACVNGKRMPYEGFRNESTEGITAEYMSVLSDTLKVTVTPLVASTWSEIRDYALTGRCDLIPHAVTTDTAEPLLSFSQPYSTEKLSLATRIDEQFFIRLDDLAGQRIGFVEGYANIAALQDAFLDIRFVVVDDVEQGLDAVASGDLFGLLDHLPIVAHAIRRGHEGELKISGEFDALSRDVRFATASGEPLLAGIVDKALAGISDAQRQTIQRKWLAVTIHSETDYRLFFRALIVAAVLLVIFAVRYVQVHKHREEVRAKNALLASLNEELEEQKRVAMKMAYHDQLTGLPNRAKLLPDLDHSIKLCNRTGNKVAVLFLDLDRFKYVNDSLGHDVGDELLKRAGAILAEQIRETDTLFRLGGDEFVIMLEAFVDSCSPSIVAQRIIDALTRPIKIGEHTVNIGTSIGIAVSPDDSVDLKKLLKYADSAMYSAKEAGGNEYRFFQRKLSEKAQRRLSIESALQDAIANDRFSLVYQPIIDLRTNRVIKAEALIRWYDPVLGHVPPDHFIPIAEDNGRIVEIGDWVLARACADYRRFLQQGCELEGISINVSSVQLQKGDIESRFRAITTEHGIAPDKVELEITERCVLEKGSGHESILQRLRRLGHRITVDDFGTGYSSLSYMKQLPLNIIKIDRSFVMNLPDDSNDVAITQALVSLAHNLGYAVVAEGCETAEQLAFLKKRKCDYVQGYYLSRPVRADQFADCIREVHGRLQPETDEADRMREAAANAAAGNPNSALGAARRVSSG